MLWLNFILGLIFIFFCINFIIIHYHTQKQMKIKIKPRIKLNHNIHTEIVVGTLWCRLLLKVCRISCILAELSRAKRASGAPWVRKLGKLSIR